MTNGDARYIADTRRHFSTATLERLYYVAQQLHFELTRRQLGCRLEAAALELALLVEADAAKRASYSVDCSTPAES